MHTAKRLGAGTAASMRTGTRALVAVLSVAALSVAALVGCGTDSGTDSGAGAGTEGGDGTAAEACPVVADVPAPRELRDRLDLADLVVWERVAAETSGVNAVGVTEGADQAGVPPVLELVRERLGEQGWKLFSLDDEGFEAELLARDADGVLLGVTLRESACPSRVEVTLSITDYAALE